MSELPLHRVEVTPKSLEGLKDTRGDSIRRQLTNDHGVVVDEVRSIIGYLVRVDLDSNQQQQMVSDLFCDPIIEHGTINNQLLDNEQIFSNKHKSIFNGFCSKSFAV